MKVISIDSRDSHLLDQVIALGDDNRATLGFLPVAAFQDYADRGQILIAVEKKAVLGYILYSVKQKELVARIIHLCVSETYRGTGIARTLVKALRNRISLFRGIRAQCRRDYAVNAIWPSLGFHAVTEIPGRDIRQKNTLDVWWLDFGHPSLLSVLDDQRVGSKTKVVIDANIFYDLSDISNNRHSESCALIADWLQEDVELCVTPEMLNEINRNTQASERQAKRRFARSFVEISADDRDIEAVQNKLRPLFPVDLDKSDESDIRQIAWAIAAKVSFFLTRDQSLRNIGDSIYDQFNIRILNPTEFIVHQDALVRETEYYPARLAGSDITVRRANSMDITDFDDLFLAPKEETKDKFRARLHSCFTDPHRVAVEVICEGKTPIATLALDYQQPGVLNIPFFRLAKHSLAPTLARHMSHRAVRIASKEARQLIKLTDPFWEYFTQANALRENGYFPRADGWIRSCLSSVGTSEQAASRLLDIARHCGMEKEFQDMADALSFATDEASMLRAERALWPCKITNLLLPVFVIPITPTWAQELFDYDLADQTLFGSRPELMLSLENAYYSASPRPYLLSSPARILWYVSQGDGRYQGVGAIRACSYLDEVAIGTPQEVYKRFKRLGIFSWDDVLALARGDYERKIIAFRFSLTELFSSPIKFGIVKDMWRDETGKDFLPISFLKASSDFFFRVYSMGTAEK